MKEFRKLTPKEEAIIVHKGTEPPFSGEFLGNTEEGTYHCKRCGEPLFDSKDMFNSLCGWVAFDDEIDNAITKNKDKDGIRTEIVCASCDAHLGHSFFNEGFTEKETRHCVNSISLTFSPIQDENIEVVYFASGCFWGTEYYFMKAKGVTHTTVGFMGGHVDNPSYEEVCEKNTGHLEVVEVKFDKRETSYEELLKLFFETHNFTQTNGQGPDIGPQYLSAIFCNLDYQRNLAKQYIDILTEKGYAVATTIRDTSKFWKAENYHQQYYHYKGEKPYCHKYTKIF
ncbi:MAG: peptide-methionine (S)-S-oxide reductase [Bacteroidales bacterium]|nr:MAG: peptide-methionine (S)-S-oxide reductase [Bacteroidales bacterium]